jgi:hypothetical protein
MSEPENFLARWSRRKRDVAEAERKDETAPQRNDPPMPPAQEQQAAEDKPFDLESLPSIESIGASTDVRAFLRPGVPPELTRAALRRAWSSDPEIRDFVGLVENGWDFNDPGAMPGFGAISPGEVARLLTQAVGEPAPEKPPAERPQSASGEQTSAIASSEPVEHDAGDVQRSENDAARNEYDAAHNEHEDDENSARGQNPTKINTK